MATEQADETSPAAHDPYARRPGYVTGADGRTDRTTTAAVAGVVAGFVVRVLLGFLRVDELLAFLVAVAVGMVVWLILRARRRAADRRSGRSPDAVAQARDRAIAEANGGRRFFVAQNPVVVIVMGGIFIAVGLGPVLFGDASVLRIVIAVLASASGVYLVVQGIGTLVLRQRDRRAR